MVGTPGLGVASHCGANEDGAIGFASETETLP
jgi:hypothetical protein